jgi:Resolvase, N terminal domain
VILHASDFALALLRHVTWDPAPQAKETAKETLLTGTSQSPDVRRRELDRQNNQSEDPQMNCDFCEASASALYQVARRNKVIGEQSRDGGIRTGLFPHPSGNPSFRTQSHFWQGLVVLWLVLSCHLGLLGVNFSTAKAQTTRATPKPDMPPVYMPQAPGYYSSRRRPHPDNSGDDPIEEGEPAGSYARYSCDAQREESIAAQQRQIGEAAARNGHIMSAELEFVDEAVSGTKLHRAGLDMMLAAVEAGRVRVLYFHSLSRLARESVITMPMLKKLVYVHNVRVISTTEGLDSTREGWEILATFLSLQHEQYIKDLL